MTALRHYCFKRRLTPIGLNKQNASLLSSIVRVLAYIPVQQFLLLDIYVKSLARYEWHLLFFTTATVRCVL